MSGDDRKRLERRVASAAEGALEARNLVTAIEVLTGLGWLHPVHLDPWRQRRVDDLEQLVQVGPEKISLAIEILRDWATARSGAKRGRVSGALTRSPAAAVLGER